MNSVMKFILMILFVFGGNLISGISPKHNFYLSISEIIYKSDKHTFEISIRFFSDDFEKTILNYNGTRIFDKEGNELRSANSSIASYLNEHFELYDDKDKKIECDFIGWETEKEVSWCYLEANHKKFKNLKVKNNLMTEMFISQKNLVYLKFEKNETSILLDRKNTAGILSFD